MKSNVNPPPLWKRFRYRLEAGALALVAWGLPLFSRSAIVCAGHGIGWALYHLSSRQRAISLANLDVAFGSSKTQDEKRRIARASMQNFISTMLALFWAPRLNQTVVRSIVDYAPAHVERMRAAQAKGRGIIFLTLHFGDWELMGLAVGYYGIPTTIVMEDMRNKTVEATLMRLRSHSGHQIITQQRAGPKLLKTLRRGGAVALLIDLNAPVESGGVWLDFFGRPVFNNAAVAGLSLRTGAPIICALAFPTGKGRVRIEYGPEIEFTPTNDYEADVRELSQACLNFCETAIRRHPELWLWSYKRWKHTPTPDRTGFPFYSSYHPQLPPIVNAKPQRGRV